MVLRLDACSGRALGGLRGWNYTGWVTTWEGGGEGGGLYQILTDTTSIFES
jgi:hypothetical protein